MIQRFRVPLGFFLAAVFFTVATPTWTSIALGVPIALAGATFRALAAGVIKKDSELATSGPYAWTRNPLYLGSFCLTVGFAVMSWNAVAAAIVIIPSIFVYPTVIRKEETHLEHLFGETFRHYREHVPCFFPRFRMGHLSFSLQQYVNNREYNTALGFMVAIAALAVKTFSL